jgi:hypothetical protein
MGNVVAAGPNPGQSEGSLAFFSDTCTMDLYLQVKLPTIYSTPWEAIPLSSILGLMEVGNIAVPGTMGTFSGSRNVPTVWLIEGEPGADGFSPGTEWVVLLEEMVGQGNLLPTTITWEFDPQPQPAPVIAPE